jgi:hypothetical protein
MMTINATWRLEAAGHMFEVAEVSDQVFVIQAPRNVAYEHG